MKKEYKDQEAYDYVVSQVNKTKINSVFKPVVIDIILRRRHEYQLDDKYFHRDVESFINNVKEIYWDDMPENFGGNFCPKKKCIRINRNAFKENMKDEQFAEKLFEIISHECQHAMNFDETGNDRTFKINPNDKADGTFPINGILEIYTEKESNRLFSNRKEEDAFEYCHKTNGYGGITDFVDVIAATAGIKEKELLSAAIKGEQELYESLNANIKDEKISKDKFKDIFFNIRIVHKELHKDEKIDSKNLAEAIKIIYERSEQILAYRINNLEWDNLEELQEKLEDIKLSQNVISKTINDRTYEDTKNFFKKNVMLDKIYIKVMCMEEIVKSKGENSRELISFVQKSESVDEITEYMKQNGIKIDSEKLALMPEFELSQQKKDEWVKEFCLDGEEWDNTEIYNYIIANRKEIEKVEERVSLLDKIQRVSGIIRKPVIKINELFVKPFKFLWKTGKNLWNALPQKDSNKEPLLLGERKTRKSRRQEIMGFI